MLERMVHKNFEYTLNLVKEEYLKSITEILEDNEKYTRKLLC
jgi:hypothetical protein